MLVMIFGVEYNGQRGTRSRKAGEVQFHGGASVVRATTLKFIRACHVIINLQHQYLLR